VNVLIALLWPPHEAHARTQRWFATNADQGWATCAMTRPALFALSPIQPSRGAWFLHEMRWKFCAPIFSIGRTGFGLTILGSQKRLLSSKGDSMVTASHGRVFARSGDSPEGKAGDSGFRVASLLADQSDEKKHLVLV